MDGFTLSYRTFVKMEGIEDSKRLQWVECALAVDEAVTILTQQDQIFGIAVPPVKVAGMMN